MRRITVKVGPMHLGYALGLAPTVEQSHDTIGILKRRFQKATVSVFLEADVMRLHRGI